jgi:hypothetical protein
MSQHSSNAGDLQEDEVHKTVVPEIASTYVSLHIGKNT